VGASQIAADRAGFIFRIDQDALVGLAAEADVRFELLHGVGDFVPEGAPLVAIDGHEASAMEATIVRRGILLGPERTMDQDGTFGVRTLVDIAQRSLSSDFNDQTTAVEVIDRLHDLLRAIADRPMPSGRFEDSSGAVRLIVPEPTWEDFISLAFDDICLAGERAPVVMRRLHAVLEDLSRVVPAERRAVLQARLHEWGIGQAEAS
jgi:uncharacterized membrane protein